METRGIKTAIARVSGLTAAAYGAGLMLASQAMAAAPAAAGTWSTATLMTKVQPIIKILFPILMFVAVIRIMWAGVKMMTGGAVGTGDPKDILMNSIYGLLWIMGAWILVSLAFSVASSVIK